MKEYVCPVTDITLRQPCKVQSCIWHSQHRDHVNGCCYGVTSPAILAKAKRIPIEEVERLKRQGQNSLAAVLLLYEYRNFLIKENLSRPVTTVTPDIAKVIQQVPYTYDNLWTVELFVAACSRENYDRFSKQTSKIMRISNVLAVSAKLIRKAAQLYN